MTQIKPGVFNLFNSIDKRLHRIKRRMISKSLSEQKMRSFEPVMLEHINTFLGNIRATIGSAEAVDMTDRCKRLGIDIIGQFSFGASLNLQMNDTNSILLNGMTAAIYRSNVYLQTPFVKWLGVELALLPSLYQLRRQYGGLLKKLVTDRLAQGKHEKEDLFSYVVDAKDKETGTKMRLSELWSEATFFFPAGSYAIRQVWYLSDGHRRGHNLHSYYGSPVLSLSLSRMLCQGKLRSAHCLHLGRADP
jgi:cytochrome P450